MSVRRRRIKDRVARERRLAAASLEFRLSLHKIQDAIDAAIARGETEATEQFFREAFVVDESAPHRAKENE